MGSREKLSANSYVPNDETLCSPGPLPVSGKGVRMDEGEEKPPQNYTLQDHHARKFIAV